MDSWLVATAAGYFAEYWQNLLSDRTRFPELRTQEAETGNGPLSSTKGLQQDISSDGREFSTRKVSDSYRHYVVSAAKVDSDSGFDSEMVGSSGHHMDHNLVSQSREDQCRKGPRSDTMRKRSTLETRYSYGHLLKPFSSLDSCIMAHLYMEHVNMEEYILTFPPSSPTAISRPLIVTDGSQIISRASGSFPNGSNRTVESTLHNLATFERSGNVFGIPPLPKVKSSDLRKKLKFKRGNRYSGRQSVPCKMDTANRFHSQQGPDDGAFLFSLGIFIGIVSSCIRNRREVLKLRGLLKHTENVVQDLHDELEMKDPVTVKEIANEKYESGETYDDSFHDRASSSVEQNFNNSKRCDGGESYYDKVGESSESMSQIEAELEAELERLGLNMNVSNLERRLSDLDELDPDFAEGELRSDMINAQALAESVSNKDSRDTSTTHSGNYAVSPRELSMRLHEVIQSKLKERIEELEMALRNSQKKVKLMEWQYKISRKISNSKLKYSSNPESPLANEEIDCQSGPLVMQLSGEALDAYIEAREELLKTDESEEEDDDDDGLPDIYRNKHQGELHKYDRIQNMSWGGQDGMYPKNTLEEAVYGGGRTLEDQHLRVHELVGVREDECSDGDDEMEKQLIEKIVEKSRKGSDALVNAERILFSMDGI
ncbi:hypothetical protein ES319_A12G192500v1 [Gossypium barbadense]|uniref:Uncharacterized protein n=4 Tax=Gossypium TaxID=3633 RepID=A0A5J5TCD7_GOSBA|nr:hypothetical protein ES319_A12G192500v1 [Gossypium barbadense]KAB2053508.1 hypothetical protein ES319_A12G192500v1 [Gossypium barbadense]TYG90780.1 hypothetical protein ES288_A12G210000v1 [Gossypium darwinii]